jgi:3-oxoacyl-[acyl-carrier protein] reductase
LFAHHGADVVCAGKSRQQVFELSDELRGLGRRAVPVTVDVRNRAACAAAIETARQFGRIDFLANFAGVWSNKNTEEIDDFEWHRITDTNLKGSFMICQAAAPVMKAQGYGRIVLVGSIAARIGGRMGGPHYAASKGGVNALARALARRLGPYGVTINSINPGPVETDMTSEWPAEAKRKMIEQTPLARLGRPIDIASVALFLASDLSQWITGETLEVNGGAYFG